MFTTVAVGAILIEAGVAVYIPEIAKTSSWDHVKDWLIIVVALFIAFATLAGAFWPDQGDRVARLSELRPAPSRGERTHS